MRKAKREGRGGEGYCRSPRSKGRHEKKGNDLLRSLHAGVATSSEGTHGFGEERKGKRKMEAGLMSMTEPVR